MRIKDIGPIVNLDIPIKPGVLTVLTGPNGSGKSHALATVNAVATGKRGTLTPRDGKAYGTVKVPGATIRISTKVSGGKGATESYAVVEDGAGLSKLIDPGLKDVHSADRARLRALLGAVGTEADPETLKDFLGKELYAGFAADVKVPTDILDLVDALRKWLHKQARECENSVERLNGSIAEIGDLPKVGDNDDAVDVDGARQLSADADQALTSAKAKREGQQAALTALEQLGDSLPELDALNEVLRGTVTELTESREAVCAAKEAVRAAEENLQSAEAKETECSSAHKVADDAVGSALRERERYRKLQSQVEDIVTEESVKELASEKERLVAAYETAVSARDRDKSVQESRERLHELEGNRDSLEVSGERCRELSTDANTLLHGALANFPGWSVDEDSRLCVTHARGDQTPYGDLSPGERAILAIDAVLPDKFEGDEIPVVALPQEIYESLDGQNRSIFCDFVAERGFAAVTAEASQSPSVTEIEAHEMAGASPAELN